MHAKCLKLGHCLVLSWNISFLSMITFFENIVSYWLICCSPLTFDTIIIRIYNRLIFNLSPPPPTPRNIALKFLTISHLLTWLQMYFSKWCHSLCLLFIVSEGGPLRIFYFFSHVSILVGWGEYAVRFWSKTEPTGTERFSTEPNPNRMLEPNQVKYFGLIRFNSTGSGWL